MSAKGYEIRLHLHTETPEESERFGIDLKRDLTQLEGVKASATTFSPAPLGSKGLESINWGEFVIAVSASGGALSALIGVLRDRTSRRRKVTLVSGHDKLELCGLGEAEQRQIIDDWIKRIRSPKGGE